MKDKNKKIVGIDGNEANIVSRVGVNVYAYEILWNLYKLQDEWKGDFKVVVYLKDQPLKDLPPENQNWQYEILNSTKPLWILTRLVPYLYFSPDKPAVLFSLSHYTPPFSPVPRICSIMDLGYLDFTGQFKKRVFWQLKWWSAISIRVSKYIISISEATKQDIVRHYPFAANKITVVPLAHDAARFNFNITDEDVRHIKNKYHIVDDYILYLGTLKPSKNLERLIQAYAQIGKDNQTPLLVIAGKKGWMYESVFKKIKDLRIDNQVLFTDFVDEADKPALYKGAKLLVSPSLTEGFGLHVLEAMACGTPVVVSNCGSLPEIVGEAGIMVDPYQAMSIAQGMTQVLSLSQKGYNELRRKGLAQAGCFSWKKSVEKVLSLLLKTIK